MIPLTSDRIPDSTVSSVLQQACKCFEIIILQNDVSSMPEGAHVREKELPACYADLPMRKLQIRKRGKGNALNIGIRHAQYDFVCVLDADCVLDEHAIRIAMQNFKDENVSAVGGRLRAVSEKKNLLTLCQRVEYMKTFHIWRPLFNLMNANCLISGAYGIFRKSDINGACSYDHDTVGEDMGLVLSIQSLMRKDGKRIHYEEFSVCNTGVPTTMRRLLRQRDRWQRGLLDCLLKYWDMTFNPHYGMLGLVAMPYQVFVELLGPIFVLLHTVNLICAAVGADWWFAFTVSFRESIGLGDWFPQMWEIYLIYLGFEFYLTWLAECLEHDGWWVIITKLPEALAATALGILMSVPLAVARLWGMISFSRRRLEW